MHEEGAFCPISLATAVVGDRWSPLILRELVIGSTRFNDIARGLPGISRSILVQRLKHLERNGVLERWPLHTGRGFEYRLTPAGADLGPILMALGHWAIEWLFEDMRPHDVDPVTLMWWMHRRVDPAVLPDQRVVVQFDHTAPERISLWLVFDRRQVSVCRQHPGFEVDVVVTATTAVLAEVFQGFELWAHAVADGRVVVEGPRHIVAALPRWFLWSPLAPATRAKVEQMRAPAVVAPAG